MALIQRFGFDPPGLAGDFNDPSNGSWTTFADSGLGAGVSDPYFGYSVASPGPFTFSPRWADPFYVSVVNDAAAPFGKAIEQRTYVGDTSAWHGFANRSNFAVQSELYIRYRFKYSSNWDWHSAGDKLIMLNLDGGRAGAFYIGTRQNGILLFRCQNGGGFLGEFIADIPPFVLVRDQYYTLEWHHIAQSAANVADGEERIYLDGELVTQWNHVGGPFLGPLTNMNFVTTGGTGIDGFQQPLYWGGQDDIKTVDDHVRYGEILAKGVT